MATAKRTPLGKRRTWPRMLAVSVVLLGALAWFYRAPIAGYTTAGTAFGARMACSCRYVAGRPLAQCRTDFEPGMKLVFLSDDDETRTVTARVPLLARESATWREGMGCALEPWRD